MNSLLHESIFKAARLTPDKIAVRFKAEQLSYLELANRVESCAAELIKSGLSPSDRVAVYLPKQFEMVISLYAISLAGGVFVPINPGLKPRQVAHILNDSGANVLISSKDRATRLSEELAQCTSLHQIITVGGVPEDESLSNFDLSSWKEYAKEPSQEVIMPPRIDQDLAAIMYTSGSTGKPKGVVLSHQNMVTGAKSVSGYLNNTPQDTILAVLPFSFDAGLSQLTTAFQAGACVVLMDYLLPRDVIKAIVKFQVTGLTAVPPLWNQLVKLDWPPEAAESLRYIANTGGAMPQATLKKLREALPKTEVFLMYGLTEAFRSTYLHPDQVSIRPTSMGKAIPSAQVMVVREDGTECDPDEPGELVHRGSLVAKGYWNDPVKTAERFKPAPGQPKELPNPEIAVWSGDQVKKDSEGYLYFITRQDEMIKTSGYRVSPTEIEEELYNSGCVTDVIALGVPHPMLGQAIVVVAQGDGDTNETTIIKYCQKNLPNFMVPKKALLYPELPRNPNGKIDRSGIKQELDMDMFKETSS